MSFDREARQAQARTRAFWDKADEKKRRMIRIGIAVCVLGLFALIAHCAG